MGNYLYTLRTKTISLAEVKVTEDEVLPTPYGQTANLLLFLGRSSSIDDRYSWSHDGLSGFGRMQKAKLIRTWEERHLPRLMCYGEPRTGASILLREGTPMLSDWAGAAWWDCDAYVEFGVLGNKRGHKWDLIPTLDTGVQAVMDDLEEQRKRLAHKDIPLTVREALREAWFTAQRERNAKREATLEAYHRIMGTELVHA